MIAKLTPIISMICLTVLEVIALYKNINGFLLVAVVTLIAGLGGYTLKNLRG